ncbi:MAG: Crp/Fnr family transcriptional regulator [Calditrichaeota bacterium]|nr:MAG: Crp/Fnr family transcriptional regulator [Calditrichota bacterium]
MNQNEMKLWYLKNIQVFKGLSDEEMRRINERMIMKNYQKREYIYLSSENLDKVFVIKKGNVEIGYIDEGGRELAIDILGKGEIFGAVMGREGYLGGYARAIDKALICHMPRQEFEEILQRFPNLSYRILKLLGLKINVLENKLQNLVFKDVKTRICELLYNLYRKSGDPDTGRIKIPLTHQDIANLVGSTRETASVYLSELKKEGVIDYERKNIQIVSLRGLERYVHEN